MRRATPNDPKLSDGGGWRDGCAVGERRRQEAASVTAGAVRGSAWLGVTVNEFVVTKEIKMAGVCNNPNALHAVGSVVVANMDVAPDAPK